jgi:hypothetical protein
MDMFYYIVIGVATVALIIMFIIMGVFISRNNVDTTYPPYTNACPNYWMADASGNCYIPKKTGTAATGIADPINIGTYTPNDPKYTKTFGLDPGNTYLNFNDKGWATAGKSATCAKKAWANHYGILWDGISNYNGSC